VIEYRSLRAPRDNESTLILPAVSTWPAVLAENRRRLDAIYQSSRGGWLSNIAAVARRDLVAACLHDMASYLLPSSVSAMEQTIPSGSERLAILLSGHQPQWFHPGVWFKNALSAKHAAALGCIPVHFALDSDTLGRAEVRSLAGDPAHPSLVTVPYDQPSPEIAIEDRAVVDIDTIDSFDERLERAIAPFFTGPTVMEKCAGIFVERARATNRLGWAIAQTRHSIEVDDEGWRNLETRMSSICTQPSFARFVGWLCEWADPLVSYHNRALADYRAVHGIRSHSHPFPDLVATENEFELPLWIWSRQNPRRKRLFLRRDGQQRSLTDREGTTILLPRQPADATDWFPGVESDIRIRPRALCTTLYSRLVLSDLFIHGIGGAKYDQVTDEIIRQWLGCEPPQFITATATVWLPTKRPKESQTDVLQAEEMLRRMRYNPELAAEGSADAIDPKLRKAIEQKQSLIANRPDEGSRKVWHESIVGANEMIRELAQGQLKSRTQQYRHVIEQGHLGETLRNRELPFCIYPHHKIPRRLLDLTVE
jgi:hypothetical protein